MPNIKYLGIIIDEKLSWKEHSENVIRDLIKIISTFKFIRHYIPNKCKKQLYYAYVYSKISYGLEIYGNASKALMKKIQVLQNKSLKRSYKKDWYMNTNILHKELQVLKVEDIVKLCILKFVHRCMTGDIPYIFENYFKKRSQIHGRYTRNVNKLEIPRYKTCTYGQRTIRYIGSKLYNILPSRITGMRPLKKF